MDWEAAGSLTLIGTLAAVKVMFILWLVQWRIGNAGIVDVGWAAVLGSLAVVYAVGGTGWPARRVLLAVLGGLWGYRLAWHLLRDRVWKQPEEGRYVTLRAKWSDAGFLVFFEAQAISTVVLAVPFLVVALDPRPAWGGTDVAGAVLVLVGWTGESLADRQLARWKADPAHRGRTCRAGLWRYSRHPNYFFEWVIWCGFAVFALGHAPWGWVGVLSPAILLYLILKVTGIPPTEAQALRSRGEDYRRYQRTTSAFFPWFPNEDAA